MKNLKNSLLATAVAGALVVPGFASAAVANFFVQTPHTVAQEVFTAANTRVWVQPSFTLMAQPQDAANPFLIGIGAGNYTVTVTLNGAVFDQSGGGGALAGVIAANTLMGTQMTGANAAITAANVVSANITGNTLTFVYTAVAANVWNPAYVQSIDSFLQLPGFQISNVTGGAVTATMSVTDAVGNLLLIAGGPVMATAPGFTVTNANAGGADVAKRIDVGSTPRATLFSAAPGLVGGSSQPGSGFINVGRFTLGVTQVNTTGFGVAFQTLVTDGAVNGNAGTPILSYAFVPSAQLRVNVQGQNLTLPANMVWLDRTFNCSHNPLTNPNPAIRSKNSDLVTGSVARIETSYTDGLLNGLRNIDFYAGPVTYNICIGANNVLDLVPQTLSATLSAINFSNVNRVPVLLQNTAITLQALQYNGAVTYFQNVNPAGNAAAQSVIRVSNHETTPCPVSIRAKDDQGRLSGTFRYTVPAHESHQFNIDDLESGNDTSGLGRVFAGNLRDGAGKWYMEVIGECNNFSASALNRNLGSGGTGNYNNLSGQVDAGTSWSVPSVPVP